MQIQDDRTEAEKTANPVLVVATDSFMSGWGRAEGGTSFAAWACPYGKEYEVERWVRSRKGMKRVRTVCGDYRPKGHGHCHIYLAKPGIHYRAE